MTRMLLALYLLHVSFGAMAADDLKVSQLEREVRNLQRDVQVMSRQMDELRSQLTRAGDRAAPPLAATAPSTDAGTWLDSSKWQRVRAGMNELDVVATLGPPTSMREEKGERVLLYAMEIGSTGFLGGSVKLRNRVVVGVRKPELQ